MNIVDVNKLIKEVVEEEVGVLGCKVVCTTEHPKEEEYHTHTIYVSVDEDLIHINSLKKRIIDLNKELGPKYKKKVLITKYKYSKQDK